jgi:hypothetical protein
VAPPRVLAASPDKVTLAVERGSGSITSGRRAWRRSTYVCSATVNGVHYRLVPTAAVHATQFVDGVARGNFTSTQPNQGPTAVVWHPDVTPQDVAAGMLLACAFGVGVHPMWRNMFRSIDASPIP